MPRTKDVAAIPVRLPDEVGIAEGNFEERTGAGIDPTRPGRWFDTDKKLGSIGARCARCGRLRRAENLRLHTRPFGKGEQWQCKEGC